MSYSKKIIKDFSVSQESFELHYDEAYHMWHTHPKPLPEDLGAYYKSEKYISHTDKNESLIEKIYQLVKMYMLARKHKIVKMHAPAAISLLDLGAGTGSFAKYCKDQGWVVKGVEPDEQARVKASDKGVDLVESYQQLKSKFDVITMWHVLEHVYDLNEQLRWIQQHLSDNGKLILAVPNFECYDAHYYKSFWAAYDVPRHLSHFSVKAIDKIMNGHGLTLIAKHPLVFDSYYVSLLSETYKSSSSKIVRLLRALRIGWLSNRKARKSGAYSSIIYVIQHQKAI